MRRIIFCVLGVALLQIACLVVWSEELKQHLGKASNTKWDVAIQSVAADTREVDVYIDTASINAKTPKTLKSTDLVGGILGKMTPNQDTYVVNIRMEIKNKLNQELQFYLHDLSLRIGKDLVRPGAYSAGDMVLPLMTIHNVEFKIPPYAKENYSFLFGIPQKATMFLLLFQDLEPIKLVRPPLPIEQEKIK